MAGERRVAPAASTRRWSGARGARRPRAGVRPPSASACHLFTVLGAAGVGKSRLVAEFLDGLGERATVVRGRCLPYGEGITFWPLLEVVRTALRRGPRLDRDALAGDETQS